VTDFDRYRADPTQRLQIDFFVPDDMPPPQGVSMEKLS
jgi:citronellol/citronellal dehydrogenase